LGGRRHRVADGKTEQSAYEAFTQGARRRYGGCVQQRVNIGPRLRRNRVARCN
jgi:hypothetical protein